MNDLKAEVIVRFSFPDRLIKEPIVFSMALSDEFKDSLIPSVINAYIDTKGGYIDLEIVGDSDKIEKYVKNIEEKGVYAKILKAIK